MITYTKIKYPVVYYANVKYFSEQIKDLGGSPLYYMEVYRDFLLQLSNYKIKLNKTYLNDSVDIKDFLLNIDNIIKYYVAEGFIE
jgi:hypothetical protein